MDLGPAAAGRGTAAPAVLRGEEGAALAPVMLVVMLVAVAARWLGYTGFFGSDEVTYTESAFKILRGDWVVDDYVGANRLGVNLPMAAFAWLLGPTEWGAAAYSLVCSLGEVALVTWAGWRMFGRRTALLAGLLMATLPTHVHFAGRLMADAPLGLAITAAFVLFFEGARQRSPWLIFLAGVCAGLSFWIKPVTMFVFGILVFYPAVERRLDLRWLWMLPGTLLAMAGNGLVFLLLKGNFWYVIDNVRERRASGYLEAGAAAGQIVGDGHYYLTFLFGKVYHTGLLAYLAIAALAWMWLRRREQLGEQAAARRYAVFWLLGLLLIMSLLPVGLNPLIFVPKQTNYMLIFLAPMCLVAGWGVAQLSRPAMVATTGLALCVGILFALLLQGSVAVFTANSWATLRLVQSQADTRYWLMSNALRAATFQALVGGPDVTARVQPVAHWRQAAPAAGGGSSTTDRMAVIDEESYSWDTSRPFASPRDVPACWQPVGELRGQPVGLGAGLLGVAAAMPGLADTAVGLRLQAMSTPKPARVYRVPAQGC